MLLFVLSARPCTGCFRIFCSAAACVQSLRPSRGFFEPQHDVCVHGASRCLIWTIENCRTCQMPCNMCFVSLKSAFPCPGCCSQVDVLRDPRVRQDLDERARCGRSSSITPLAPNTTTPFPSTSTQPFPNTTTTEGATRRAVCAAVCWYGACGGHVSFHGADDGGPASPVEYLDGGITTWLLGAVHLPGAPRLPPRPLAAPGPAAPPRPRF